MTRKTRDTRKVGKRSDRGKTISVQFFLDEDQRIRDAASLDGRRPVSDMVRVLALEALELRSKTGNGRAA